MTRLPRRFLALILLWWAAPTFADTTALQEILPASSQAGVAGDVTERVSRIAAEWTENRKRAYRAVDQWQDDAGDSAFPWVVEAWMRFEEKRYKKCLALCNKALARDAHSADAYYWRARAFEAQGKPLEAANEYQTALAAQESFAQAKAGLDRAMAALGSPTGTP